MTEPENELTTPDSLFNGRLICHQHRHGYRFSVDAVLLAHFFAPKKNEKILDLGAGCGVVSLILAWRWPGVRLTAIEIQPGLAALCRQNVTANALHDRISVVEGDLQRLGEFVASGGFDWVVCNPPYRKPDSGRTNPQPEQALARHEFAADIKAIVKASSFALRTGGRLALVYPTARTAVLIAALKEQRLEPKRLRMVHSYPGSDGKLVLIEAIKEGCAELTVLPPFYIYQARNGEYSDEMARCYEAS